jgi:peptidoglycan hydrolase CwlO-like protein
MPRKKKQETEESPINEVELLEKIESNKETITKLFHASIIGLSSFMILIFVFLFNSETSDKLSSEIQSVKNEVDNIQTIQLNIMYQMDSIENKIERSMTESRELSSDLQQIDNKLSKNYKKVNYVSETLDTLVMFIKK